MYDAFATQQNGVKYRLEIHDNEVILLKDGRPIYDDRMVYPEPNEVLPDEIPNFILPLNNDFISE